MTTISQSSTARRRLGIATDAALLILSAVKDSADAYPPLKTTAAGIFVLIDIVQTFKSNKKEWDGLVTLIAERVGAIAEHTGTHPHPQLAFHIEKLTAFVLQCSTVIKQFPSKQFSSQLYSTLNEIVVNVKSLQIRNPLVRVMQAQHDKKKIASFHEKMKTALDNFHLIGTVAIWKAVANPIPQIDTLTLNSSGIPPPPPIHLYGRDDYVNAVVATILSRATSPTASRLVIRGPGGIGKTSLALAVFHNTEIESLFGTRRYFVMCESANTESRLLSAIASTLEIDLSKGDAFRLVLQGFQISRDPLLLFLDNAETIWYCDQRAEVKMVLQQIAALAHVTLVLTMRGTELPNVTSWDRLQPLGILTLEAAREAFLAIAAEQLPSPSLDRLLELVDCYPLAVTLLAQIAQIGGDTPDVLCDRWCTESSGLLRLEDSGRENNMSISIKLSLECKPMKETPLALRLLSIIAYLPNGISEADIGEITGLPVDGIRAASHTLKRLSLVHMSAMSWITTLSPIRAYMKTHHPCPLENLIAIRNWHLSLCQQGRYKPGDSEFQHTVEKLTAHKNNLSHVLQSLLKDNLVSKEVAEGILSYSRFLYWTEPNGDLLKLLLQCNSGTTTWLKAHTLQCLGDIMRMQNNYASAWQALEEARTEFVAVGNQLGAAQCLKSLGQIMYMQDNYDGAQQALEEARTEFVAVGDRLGAAQCLQRLGDNMHMQDNYDGAWQALEEARTEFVAVGNRLGAAQCLQSLGDNMHMQDNYDGARQALEEARTEFVAVGDRLGAAQCLRSLGDNMRMQDNYNGARQALEEARTEFVAVGDRLGAAQCLRSLGDNMRMQNNYDGAWQALEEARTEFVAVGDRLGAAQCLQRLGDNMHMQDNYDGAWQALEEARTEFVAVGDRLGAAQCLQSLGDNMQMQDNYDGAWQALEEARTEFVAVGNRLGAAQCLQSLGDNMHMQDNYDSARQALEEARTGFVAVGNRLSAAQCLQSLGDNMQMQDNYDGARQAFEEARTEFVAVGDRLGAAQCLRSLGDNMRMQDNYNGARQALEEARTEFVAVGNRLGAAQCLRSLGDNMRMQNNYDGAWQALEEARTEFVAVGDRLGAAQCLQRLGDNMHMQDNYDGAQQALEEARTEFVAVGDRLGAAQCLQRLGDNMHMQDNYDGAWQALEEARTEFVAVGDRLGAAQCLQRLGDNMHMQDNYDGAQQALEEARTEFVAVGNRLSAAQCLQRLGDNMPMQDNYDGARQAFEEARTEFVAVGNQLGAAQCLQSLGDIMDVMDA